MALLSSAQKNVLNNLTPSLVAQGISLGTILEDLYGDITSGNLGITAEAEDVDSLALDGGHAVRDTDSESGLNFYWKAFRFYNGLALVTVSAGHVTLAGSNTNYIEVDRAGTVSSNTSGFTSGRLPLWTVVTGSGSINTVTNKKPLLQLIGLAGVVGSMLSTPGATKELLIPLGDVAATTSFSLVMPNVAGAVAKVSFVTKTAIAADDTNYWKFGLVNKGAAGSGTTKIVDDTAAANSTKVTGGSAITGYVKRDLTISGTPADLVTAAGDVMELTVTKAASATTMAQCAIRVDVTFAA